MENSIEAFFKLINSEYFTNEQYTVSTIGNGNPEGSHMYCVPATKWISDTIAYMTQMFNAAGIDTSTTTFSSSDFLLVAKNCHDYVASNGFTYEQQHYPDMIPINQSGYKTIDCSSYVSWVLYEYGYTELAGYGKNTSDLLSWCRSKGFTVKSGSQAVAGDILLNVNSHTEIYAGNNRSYNCGGDSSIRASSSSCTPSSFTYAITVNAP